MKKHILLQCWFILLLFVGLAACSDNDGVPMPPPPLPEENVDGISYFPENPEATEELRIVFKAEETSQLYGYTGDVYAHIGVVEGEWLYVPAEWDENIEKCKMASEEDNVWSLTLSPDVRTWFGVPDGQPVNKIGIVVRSADGTIKGLQDDFFITVEDDSFTPGEVVEEAMPAGVKEGINIVNNTVTLVLYDVDTEGNHKDYVYLIGDFNDWTRDNDYQMKRDNTSGCWWHTLTGLDPATEYAFQYYVGSKTDGNIRLADPYTEKVLLADDKYISSTTYPNLREYPADKTSGIVSTFQMQTTPYSWGVTDFKITDKSNLVIYEMLFRDFTETGDIKGAMAKLDYIEALGVNAIELMPVQEFDGNDSWGYNPCFFFAMDKAYGTKEMYKEFIDQCHQRGIAVILDVVYNHATGNHPFAKLYWNADKNRTAANNPWFNEEAPHPYSVFHDFNHESPLVRQFVKRNLEFLIEEYKIDGFRFDLTKGFTQNSSTEGTASNYDASRITILKDYNATIKAANPDVCVILEHFAEEREEAELAGDGMKMWRNVNHAYMEAAMGWPNESSFVSLTTMGTTMPFGGWVGYMESHDEERAAYKQTAHGNGPLKTDLSARMKQLETNAAFFFTVAEPKMIWQFGELGYDISIDYNGRTGRKPVKWDYYDVPERKQLHDTYSKLIQLRWDHPELFSSNRVMGWKVTASDWDGGRFITLESAGGKRVVVAGNFTNEAKSLSVTFPVTGTWYNYMVDGETLDVTSGIQTLTIPANEFRLYTSFN